MWWGCDLRWTCIKTGVLAKVGRGSVRVLDTKTVVEDGMTMEARHDGAAAHGTRVDGLGAKSFIEP